MPDRLTFVCNGRNVEVEVEAGESLLSVLRERLGLVSVKDGCAPQGQCGCCTVLVDGDARVACVTAAARVGAAVVTTSTGSTRGARSASRPAFVDYRRLAVRLLHARDHHAARRADAAAARSTRHSPRTSAGAPAGGRVYDAIELTQQLTAPAVDLAAAARAARRRRRATGRRPMYRSAGRFADDIARRATRWSLYRSRPGPMPTFVEAAGLRWVIGESLDQARPRAGKVQGRRTTVDIAPPLPLPPMSGRRRAARDVVGRARVPRARRVVVRARRRARVARSRTAAHSAARRTRSRRQLHASWPHALGRTVRVAVLARRRRPARTEATAHLGDSGVARRPCHIEGVGRAGRTRRSAERVPGSRSITHWAAVGAPGRPSPLELRAVGLAEHAVLVEGALDAARVDRAVADRRRAALLDTLRRRPVAVRGPGARVTFDDATRSTRRRRGPRRGRRSARRDGLAVLRAGRRAHGARLGSHRVDRRRSRHGRGARPDHPIVRHHPGPRHAAGRDHDPRRRRAPARCVRRGVRRGCRRDVERAATAPRALGPIRSRRGDPRVATAPEVVMPVTPVPTPNAPPVAGPYSPAGARGGLARARRAGRRSIPRPASWPTALKRRPARSSPTSPRCSATAARRSTTSPRPSSSSPTSATSRRSTRSTRRPSATTSPAALDRPGRRASPPAHSSRSKPGPTSAGDNPPITWEPKPPSRWIRHLSDGRCARGRGGSARSVRSRSSDPWGSRPMRCRRWTAIACTFFMSGALRRMRPGRHRLRCDREAGDEPTGTLIDVVTGPRIDPPPADYTPIAAGIGSVVQRWGDDSTGTDEPFTMLAPTGAGAERPALDQCFGHRVRGVPRRPQSGQRRIPRQLRDRRGVHGRRLRRAVSLADGREHVNCLPMLGKKRVRIGLGSNSGVGVVF